MDWGTIKLRFLIKTPLLYFIIFFSIICALISTINCKTPCLDNRCMLTVKANFYSEELEKGGKKKNGEWTKASGGNRRILLSFSLARTRRILSGPGSSPPRCTSKCGRCTPCKPVRVTVPPETPVTAEYYPEAWRCKCGNKLYMP